MTINNPWARRRLARVICDWGIVAGAYLALVFINARTWLGRRDRKAAKR